jgi:hypothetical protein
MPTGVFALEWWRLHHWVLRALLVVGIVLLTYVGVLGITAASSVSEDGAQIAMVIGGIFLFLAAIMFWWLCVDLRRD